jgi:hypothetical protein
MLLPGTTVAVLGPESVIVKSSGAAVTVTGDVELLAAKLVSPE